MAEIATRDWLDIIFIIISLAVCGLIIFLCDVFLYDWLGWILGLSTLCLLNILWASKIKPFLKREKN